MHEIRRKRPPPGERARDAVNNALTREEILALPIGAFMMTFEVGMRFLTDYLNGDVYFKVKHDRHNLIRARNQLKLVADIEAKMGTLEEIVGKYI